MEHLYLWNLFFNSIWGKKGQASSSPPSLTASVFLRPFPPSFLSIWASPLFILFRFETFSSSLCRWHYLGRKYIDKKVKRKRKNASRVKIAATARCSLPPGILSEEIKQIIIFPHHRNLSYDRQQKYLALWTTPEKKDALLLLINIALQIIAFN